MTPILPMLVACVSDVPTWQDAGPIVHRTCAGCHREGQVAPIPLETHRQVVAASAMVRDALESGHMPPWRADPDCSTVHPAGLTDAERELLLDWLAFGAPRGGEVERPEEPPPSVDLELTLPMAYTPSAADEHRCQLVEIGLDAPTFVTGITASPGEPTLVREVVVYRVGPERRDEIERADNAHQGPGWPCYGGHGDPGQGSTQLDTSELSIEQVLTLLDEGTAFDAIAGLAWLGSWNPATGGALPEGTGIRVEPDDMLVVQMHYDTTAGTAPDLTRIGLTTASDVAHPAIVVPFTAPAWALDIPLLGTGMNVPAGELVTHTASVPGDGPLLGWARRSLGLDPDANLQLHGVAPWMHRLGRTLDNRLEHVDGSETCLLRVNDWDARWRTRYDLPDPVLVRSDDHLHLSCSFDNTPTGQPLVDGAPPTPADAAWGERATDEMCLGLLLLTGE